MVTRTLHDKGSWDSHQHGVQNSSYKHITGQAGSQSARHTSCLLGCHSITLDRSRVINSIIEKTGHTVCISHHLLNQAPKSMRTPACPDYLNSGATLLTSSLHCFRLCSLLAWRATAVTGSTEDNKGALPLPGGTSSAQCTQPRGQPSIPWSADFFLPKKMTMGKDREVSATRGCHHLRKKCSSIQHLKLPRSR